MRYLTYAMLCCAIVLSLGVCGSNDVDVVVLLCLTCSSPSPFRDIQNTMQSAVTMPSTLQLASLLKDGRGGQNVPDSEPQLTELS